jgi:hypothetical protein
MIFYQLLSSSFKALVLMEEFVIDDSDIQARIHIRKSVEDDFRL